MGCSATGGPVIRAAGSSELFAVLSRLPEPGRLDPDAARWTCAATPSAAPRSVGWHARGAVWVRRPHRPAARRDRDPGPGGGRAADGLARLRAGAGRFRGARQRLSDAASLGLRAPCTQCARRVLRPRRTGCPAQSGEGPVRDAADVRRAGPGPVAPETAGRSHRQARPPMAWPCGAHVGGRLPPRGARTGGRRNPRAARCRCEARRSGHRAPLARHDCRTAGGGVGGVRDPLRAARCGCASRTPRWVGRCAGCSPRPAARRHACEDLLAWLRAPGLLERPELADRLEAAARRTGVRARPGRARCGRPSTGRWRRSTIFALPPTAGRSR